MYNLQRNEAQILKNLKHSSIPIIYDIEENENGSYIVEEYLEGRTLREFVEEKEGLNEDIVVGFALQLCDLFTYLHSIKRPLIYLDLKPDNIIITGNSLKLVDFGSAIYSDEADVEQDFYATRGFAAPEVYKRGRIDERCDVYGIGMLMYYMATCNNADSNIKELIITRKLSKHFKKIISRCLSFNPSQRYASVSQLSKQLSAIRKNNSNKYELGHSIRFAVAGAQTRIGATHLALRLSSFFIHNNIKCLYEEVNSSEYIREVKSRYKNVPNINGIHLIKGIPMLHLDSHEAYDTSNYNIIISDYGTLIKENLSSFLEADIKLLILGAKDWELSYSEKVLSMLTDYKDVLYLFNFLDGRQFKKVMSSMSNKSCYRIPYEPDPYSKAFDNCSMDFYKEITDIRYKLKDGII